MLTADCRHGNAVVSAGSIEPVASGNASVVAAVTNEPRLLASRNCQAIPHDVLWRRLDLETPDAAKMDQLAEDDEVDGENAIPLVASRTCTSSKHDHRRRRQRRRQRRRRRAAAHLCQVEKCRLRMRDDVFPAYVETGRCVGSRTCLFGLYECVPRRHAVKLLRRLSPDDARGCLPVPAISSDSVYEDVWVPFDFLVTVACECSRRRSSGIYLD